MADKCRDARDRARTTAPPLKSITGMTPIKRLLVMAGLDPDIRQDMPDNRSPDHARGPMVAPSKHIDMQDIIGWDIGGAHLKAARTEERRHHRRRRRSPARCGSALASLTAPSRRRARQIGRAALNAITMTGELSDAFATRAEGVAGVAAIAERLLSPERRILRRPRRLRRWRRRAYARAGHRLGQLARQRDARRRARAVRRSSSIWVRRRPISSPSPMARRRVAALRRRKARAWRTRLHRPHREPF